MPAIPLYQQQTQASGSLNVSSPDIGSQTSQAVGNLGNAVSSFGAVKNSILQEQAERSARSWAGPAISKAELDWTEALQKRKEAALPGAPDFTPGVLADFDAYSSKLVDAAPSTAAKDFVSQHMQALKTQLGKQSLEFEAQSRVGLRIDNAQATVDNAAKVVQQDPSQYGKMMALARETMPSVGPEAQKQLNDRLIMTMTNAAASHQMEADPYAVQELTSKAMGHNGFKGKTGTPWVDDATAEQVKQWNNTATTKIKMIESELARTSEARTKAATDVFGAATDLTFKGQFFSEPYKAQLRAAVKGTVYEGPTEELISSQAQTAGFASAPASDRAAVLNDMRSRGADPKQGTNPEMSKQIDKVIAIDGEIRKATEENPWVAAQKYGVLRDASAVQLSSPSDIGPLIKSRAQNQMQVESWVGHAVSPFQPVEVEAVSKMARNLPVDQTASMLATIGGALGNVDRVAALGKQMHDKDGTLGLAMMYANTQTSEGRYTAELVLRGEQALRDKVVAIDSTAVTGWKAEISKQIRGAFSDRQAEDSYIDAAFKIAAANFAKDGSADVPRALRLATGGIIERGAGKIPLPYGMTETDFDKKINALQGIDFITQAPDGVVMAGRTSMPIADFVASLPSATLVHAGQGLYNVRAGSTLVTNAQGRRITIKVSP